MKQLSLYTSIIAFGLCGILLASCSEPNNSSWGVNRDDKQSNAPDSLSEATVECSFIADGDTWYYYNNSKKYTVRVLGIDCFETSINDRLADQAERANITKDSALILGLKAKSLADSLLKNQQVLIRKGSSAPNRDSYDRLLRYCLIDSTKRYDSIIIARKLDVNTFNK